MTEIVKKIYEKYFEKKIVKINFIHFKLIYVLKMPIVNQFIYSILSILKSIKIKFNLKFVSTG